MRLLQTTDKNFSKNLNQTLSRRNSLGEGVEQTVRQILQAIEKRKDKAVLQFTRQLDQWKITSKNIEVSAVEIENAYKSVSSKDLKALKLAAQRIRQFHQRITLKSWEIRKQGVRLGQKVTPMDRVGIYVPGGKAAYPSSVLMNAIPARVAGVREIIMVSPFPKGLSTPHVLVAADLAGVDRIFKIGGAQAVGALAYGTQSIPKVDKIVGPGNIYVATAKRQVFGQVDIDMIAGPSEVLVLCDGKTNPSWVAADLLSQAEHDEQASAILITWDPEFIPKVQKAIEEILKILPRSAIARKSLKNHGALILAQNAEEAAEISNVIAPEHLELSVLKPRKLLQKIRHAGAIFLGSYTTESFGDYLAGPNHVLPTNGTARFSSPLSTLDFLKFSSIVESSARSLRALGPTVVHLANQEGLQAHALAMELRLNRI